MTIWEEGFFGRMELIREEGEDMEHNFFHVCAPLDGEGTQIVAVDVLGGQKRKNSLFSQAT